MGCVRVYEGFGLGDDEKSFFISNYHDHSIDEINLDRKEFVKTFPLDAEGPNGLGNAIYGLQYLDDDNLFFPNQCLSPRLSIERGV
ncbi:DUF4221 family protein [Cyclobacterium jeungdonense]|uniref:DUF4221 family protein n=1 Tax=Cyclobacterium jeungdonense TaxID=708087 RepID=UPI0013D23046